MSTHFLNAAFAAVIKPSATKFVLVALADYANELGESYPSTETMEHKTCQDRKTILASVSRLIDMGVLQDTGERKGKTKQIPVYKILIEKLQSIAFDRSNSTEKGTVKKTQTVPKKALLNDAENGTVPKTEQYRFSRETVPFFPENEGKESQKRDTEPSVYNHQLEPSVLEPTGKQSQKKEMTKLSHEWLEKNEAAMKQVYFGKMRESELKATEQRWSYIKGDFVEHWINSATNADKFKKKDWLGTWKNQVEKQINYNKLKWKTEESRGSSGAKSRLGSLDDDYLKDADWDRIFKGEG